MAQWFAGRGKLRCFEADDVGVLFSFWHISMRSACFNVEPLVMSSVGCISIDVESVVLCALGVIELCIVDCFSDIA